jgi:hypothetical protein
VKHCNEIQWGLNERKTLIQNEKLIKFIEFGQLQNNNFEDVRETLTNVSEYLRKLSFTPLILFDSINLNNLLVYLNKNVRKAIFCNLCNEFKSQTGKEVKLCDRHIICENCFSNYSKKIQCIKEKNCYCQTKAY